MKILVDVWHDSSSGFGNLRRCEGFAEYARKQGHEVTIDTEEKVCYNDFAWIVIDRPSQQHKRMPTNGVTKTCFVNYQDWEDTDSKYDLTFCGGDLYPYKDGVNSGFKYVMIRESLKSFVDSPKTDTIYFYRSIYRDLRINDLLDEMSCSGYNIFLAEGNFDVDHYLARARVVVSPYGMTTCEANYLRIPSVCYCPTGWGENSAKRMQYLYGTEFVKFDDKFIKNAMDAIARSWDAKPFRCVDGDGNKRILNMMVNFDRSDG